MSARVLPPSSLDIPLSQSDAQAARWFPLTEWLDSAQVRDWRALLQLRDPTSTSWQVQPAWQVALGDPTDNVDLSTPAGVDLVYQSGTAVTSAPPNVTSGRATATGRYLSDWVDIQGVTHATPGSRVNGTALSFFVRFGVLVTVQAGSVQFDRGQVTLTVAVRD